MTAPPSPPSPPPRVARTMPWTRVSFAALDFEATGLDMARDTIVSFGVVPIVDGRIDVGDSSYELVDPQDVPPSPGSIGIHMLRPMDLAGALTLDQARERLRSALDGRFLVTWYAGVETAFLDKLYGGGSRRWLRRSVDVRKLVLALDRLEGEQGDTGTGTLADAATRFGVPVASPHHALDDALVTAQLFLVTATRLAGHGHATVRRLLAETRRKSPLLPRSRAPS